MKRSDYELIREYVENFIDKGVGQPDLAKRFYEIIYGDPPFFGGNQIDVDINRWWVHNQDLELEEDEPMMSNIVDLEMQLFNLNQEYSNSLDYTPDEMRSLSLRITNLENRLEAAKAEYDEKTTDTTETVEPPVVPAKEDQSHSEDTLPKNGVRDSSGTQSHQEDVKTMLDKVRDENCVFTTGGTTTIKDGLYVHQDELALKGELTPEQEDVTFQPVEINVDETVSPEEIGEAVEQSRIHEEIDYLESEYELADSNKKRSITMKIKGLKKKLNG